MNAPTDTRTVIRLQTLRTPLLMPQLARASSSSQGKSGLRLPFLALGVSRRHGGRDLIWPHPDFPKHLALAMAARFNNPWHVVTKTVRRLYEKDPSRRYYTQRRKVDISRPIVDLSSLAHEASIICDPDPKDVLLCLLSPAEPRPFTHGQCLRGTFSRLNQITIDSWPQVWMKKRIYGPS